MTKMANKESLNELSVDDLAIDGHLCNQDILKLLQFLWELTVTL